VLYCYVGASLEKKANRVKVTFRRRKENQPSQWGQTLFEVEFEFLFVCFKGGMGTGACPGPPLPDKRVRICRRSPEWRVTSAPLVKEPERI
jgi:hypothetical protein